MIIDTANLSLGDYEHHTELFDAILEQIATEYKLDLLTQTYFSIDQEALSANPVDSGSFIDLCWNRSIKQLVKLKIQKVIIFSILTSQRFNEYPPVA